MQKQGCSQPDLKNRFATAPFVVRKNHAHLAISLLSIFIISLNILCVKSEFLFIRQHYKIDNS